VTPQPFYRTLYFQVLIAISFGVLLGAFWPETAVKFQPLSDGFIKLIKMIVAPVIFCTVVTGIASMESTKSVGKTGLLALIYFEFVTSFALVIGLIVINVFQPGVGLDVDASQLDASKVAGYMEKSKQQSVVEFVLKIIPNTFVSAFAEGDILQVLLISLLFGFALHVSGERGKPILDLIERFTKVMFVIVEFIMKLAPLGAFGAMAYTIGKFGLGSLKQLGGLMLCFYATCLFFVFVVLGAIARAHGFSIVKFVRYIREELFIVLGTSSSESALPRLMDKLENVGCSKSVVGLVVPTGYSFNLDGTSIYLTMAAVFLAQATNTPLSIGEQITLLVVLLLTSKGAAAVTGGGFIALAATLAVSSNIPVAALAFIFGIDRFMSEARALTNLVGNGVATIVVAKWCGQIDDQRLREHL
jgi:aerobic C4-dicarboxylate transport protein